MLASLAGLATLPPTTTTVECRMLTTVFKIFQSENSGFRLISGKNPLDPGPALGQIIATIFYVGDAHSSLAELAVLKIQLLISLPE
jgi:hypothetical protein